MNATPTTLRTWATRRRTKRLEGPSPVKTPVIEFVPGAADGERAYFWIGSDQGCFATLDAHELAAWIDSIRGVTPPA